MPTRACPRVHPDTRFPLYPRDVLVALLVSLFLGRGCGGDVLSAFLSLLGLGAVMSLSPACLGSGLLGFGGEGRFGFGEVKLPRSSFPGVFYCPPHPPPE